MVAAVNLFEPCMHLLHCSTTWASAGGGQWITTDILANDALSISCFSQCNFPIYTMKCILLCCAILFVNFSCWRRRNLTRLDRRCSYWMLITKLQISWLYMLQSWKRDTFYVHLEDIWQPFHLLHPTSCLEYGKTFGLREFWAYTAHDWSWWMRTWGLSH